MSERAFDSAVRIYPMRRETLRDKLVQAGLRPTRQRISLGALLFSTGPRHVTAESLYHEANRLKLRLSLATVYNTLHQFTLAGLLREIAVPGSRSWFDTTTGPHYHFLVEQGEDLLDIPGNLIDVVRLPPPPEGMEIVGADIIVRIRPKHVAC